MKLDPVAKKSQRRTFKRVLKKKKVPFPYVPSMALFKALTYTHRTFCMFI